MSLLSDAQCTGTFNSHLAFSDSCNKYQFEVTHTVDTCNKHDIKVFKNGSTTPYYTTTSRNFKVTFADTGTYIVRVSIKNTCTKCDTLFYNTIHVTCGSSSSSTSCNWSKAKIQYSAKCKNYTFEMGSIDTCLQYTTAVIKAGTSTWDTVSHNRVFNYTFASTGLYYIKTTFYNKCHQCDTFIAQPINVTCDTTKTCNWSKAKIQYSAKCKNYTFEMGSIDTCLQYTTTVIKAGTSTWDTISHSRVFNYTFASTGLYYIKTKFYNKCHQCDTAIVQSLNVTCDTTKTCDWSKAKIQFSAKCKNYTFEMGGYIDTCVKYTTATIKAGSSTYDTISNSRVFNYTFPSTGLYYVVTHFYNKCHNCDTVIYRPIQVNCDSTYSCNFSKAKIQYSAKCNKYTFEMGSIDTCLQYSTVLYTPGTNQFTTLSSSRVFSYTFPSKGTYQIATLFHDKCHNCDTLLYTQINVSCDSISGIYQPNMANFYVVPNPADNYLRVDFAGSTTEIVLQDLKGVVIYRGNTINPVINTSEIQNGIYFLRIGFQTARVEIIH
ncbi:MAG: T9SS type A sorting domain-containing protein [Bacteroidia bacterium]